MLEAANRRAISHQISDGRFDPTQLVARTIEGIERSDDIGPDYAPTLRHWRDRFLAQLPAVTALGFDAPFVRTWLMYLAFSEAAFAERTLGNHQLLLTRR